MSVTLSASGRFCKWRYTNPLLLIVLLLLLAESALTTVILFVINSWPHSTTGSEHLVVLCSWTDSLEPSANGPYSTEYCALVVFYNDAQYKFMSIYYLPIYLLSE